MRIAWVLVLFSTPCFLIVSCLSDGGNCEATSARALVRYISRDLYVIERSFNRLVNERVKDQGGELDQIPLLLHWFLSSRFQEAEKVLGSLIGYLTMCSEGYFTGSVYVSEAIVDFANHALTPARRAQASILKLNHCHDIIITGESNQTSQNHSDAKTRTCLVDGTKCQYSPCAKGKKLHLCGVGFAAGTTGGARGQYYLVTHPGDDYIDNPAPGTLRFAVNFAGSREGGAWIRFKDSMVIKLKDKLWVPSNTTIDGRGVNVTIKGEGLVLAKVENVILHNFEVMSTGQSDTVHVFDGSRRIWIDHLTSKDGKLGLVTVVQGSTDVTISNCYLSNHIFNMLLGASDEDTMDRALRVTVYRNWFDSSDQRMPHCRWGYCHVVNNYYKDWKYYAIGGRVHAKVLSELNVFEPGRKLEVTPWFQNYTSDLTPTIESSSDLLLNGATFHQFLRFGTLSAPQDEFPSYELPTRPTDGLVNLVTICAGVLRGHKLIRCLATQ